MTQAQQTPAMINSPLNTPGTRAQCQKQQHLGGCIPLSFLFQEQTFSLRRDMSQQPGQNHKPEKELTAEELQDHSGQGGHRPQRTQSHPRLPGSRVRGHTWTLWGKEAVMIQRLLRARPTLSAFPQGVGSYQGRTAFSSASVSTSPK